jgi:membrane protease YdiL (CAAX protease family)
VVFAVLVLGLEAGTFLARLDRDVVPFVLVLVPPVAALLVTATRGGSSDVKRLFGRLGRWRVGWSWYAAAVGIPLVEKLVVDLSGIALGETTPARLVGSLNGAAFVVPFIVLVPAMLEEFGWRGFGTQTAADDGHSPAWAATVVGAIFVLLHVPLYLPGQLYDGLPFWPLPIVLLAGSVLLTWIYLRTGSVLLAGLMHASLNATVPLTWGLDPGWVWRVRAVVLAVIAIAVVFGAGWRWWLSPERTASQPGSHPKSAARVAASRGPLQAAVAGCSIDCRARSRHRSGGVRCGQ